MSLWFAVIAEECTPVRLEWIFAVQHNSSAQDQHSGTSCWEMWKSTHKCTKEWRWDKQSICWERQQRFQQSGMGAEQVYIVSHLGLAITLGDRCYSRGVDKETETYRVHINCSDSYLVSAELGVHPDSTDSKAQPCNHPILSCLPGLTQSHISYLWLNWARLEKRAGALPEQTAKVPSLQQWAQQLPFPDLDPSDLPGTEMCGQR
jgi:hypothetical protein